MPKRRITQLIVRNVDENLVKLLKVRAVQHGRSAEAEHREILKQALRGGGDAASFHAYLLEMPNVGEDRDFERVRDRGRKVAL